MNFIDIQEITSGQTVQLYENRSVRQLSIDSRKVVPDEDVLFFAIKGERHDGHLHLHEAYSQGIRQFVIEQPVSLSNMPDANVMLVASTVKAIQQIVSAHRKEFSIPVIGITGSNGKTIVKEWLYQLLSRDYVIAKNPGSYNSQVGVPLSVWQLMPYHQLGIFEAGISKPGEMERLERVIQPTIGIFTTIGSAHDDGFSSLTQKIEEKMKLFGRVDCLIYCKDHEPIDHAVQQQKTPALSWGFTPTATVHIEKKRSLYVVGAAGKSFELKLPFSDLASIENCFHCVAVMIYLKVPAEEIQQRILGLKTVPMRLELKEGINQCQLIDDTYNNDLAGLRISIDFLMHQQQKKNKRIILSDVMQSGLDDASLAKNIADMVHKSSVNSFIGIGPVLEAHKDLFHLPSECYPDVDSYLSSFNPSRYQNEVILIKGARNFQFEKIVHRFQRKVHGTVMEIDLGALVHNLNFFRSRLRPETKLMVMVKAFAYGSGSIEVANVLQYHRVDYLGVAYADEGVELRRNNITIPIMVMNPSEESFDQLLAHQLEPEIYNFKIFQALLLFLNKKPCTIHLKLDTGMRRLGFERHEVVNLIALLKENPQIKVASIFSHHAGADEAVNDDFSFEQVTRFKEMADQLISHLNYRPLCHILNSPGILRLPQLQMDMVRLGIGLYGVDPTHLGFPLKVVATLKTIISQIKRVAAGETVGYGRKGKATRPMTIATIAIGYADGFSRSFSQGVGKVLIHGKRAPVVGNVCMDMTMVDITGIDAEEGDEVVIFSESLPIQELAAAINTIPYEILTNTSERVRRIFTAEGI